MAITHPDEVMQLHCHTLRTSKKTFKFIKYSCMLLNCYSREHFTVQTWWEDDHCAAIVEIRFCHKEYLFLKLIFFLEVRFFF